MKIITVHSLSCMYGTTAVKEFPMAKFLYNLFKLPKFSTVFKKSLSSLENKMMLSGRWALDYDVAVQERKVYWANMDNCGCCHVDNVVDVKKIQKKHETEREDDDFILPYIV